MTAALLRKMADMGLTLEQAIELMETMEAGASPSPRSANAERQARFRAKRSESVTDNVTSNATSDAPLPSPTPPSNTKNPTPFTPLKGGVSPSRSDPASCQALSSEIWQITPKRGRQRSGKASLDRAVAAVLRKGADPARVLAGIRGCYASDDFAEQFAPGVHRVLSTGQWEAFAEGDDAGSRTAGWGDDEWRTALAILRERDQWDPVWGPRPGEPGCRIPPNLLLSAA
jgi:hypothetical protein